MSDMSEVLFEEEEVLDDEEMDEYLEEEFFEEHMVGECDCHEFMWMKGICPGAESIEEVSLALRDAADWLDDLALKGYKLEYPEDNGHVNIYHPERYENARERFFKANATDVDGSTNS